MELLTYIGQLNSRRKTLENRAQELAYTGKHTVEGMEKEMRDRNIALVERLRREKIRFTEFQRVAADETVTAALAGLMVGSKKKKLTDAQFADATRSLPFLWRLFNDVEKSIQSGRLESVNDYEEYDYETLFDILEEELGDEELEALMDGNVEGLMGVATWEGAVGRMDRFLASPIYGFVAAGAMSLATLQGNTMMRRVARRDRRTCPDCIQYDSQGWVPIGSLPPPGRLCACHERCRCEVIYM